MDAFRLTLRTVRLPAAALLLGAVLYIAASWHRPVDGLTNRLVSAAGALQGVADASDTALLREIAATGGYDRVWIVDGSGLISASSHPREAGRKLERPWLDLLASASGPTLAEGAEWGARTMFMAAHRSARTGSWSVVLQDGSSVTTGRHRLILLTLASVLGLLILVGAGTYVSLQRDFLRPLLRLEDAAEAALAGDPSRRASLDRIVGGSQIGRIATALGSMWRERDEIASRLKEQQALFFSILNLAREMVLIASFEGIVLDVNKSFCKRLGLKKSGVVGRPLSELEGKLAASAIADLGERSAREQRVFERLIFTFPGGGGGPLNVVAAVQAVPFGGQAAFMLVADDRTNEQALAAKVSELIRELSTVAASGATAEEASGEIEGG